MTSRSSEKWYASSKVVWGLLSIVASLFGLIVMTAYAMIWQHEERIRKLEIKIERIRVLMEKQHSQEPVPGRKS